MQHLIRRTGQGDLLVTIESVAFSLKSSGPIERVPVSEMTVSSGTLNPSIPYHTIERVQQINITKVKGKLKRRKAAGLH